VIEFNIEVRGAIVGGFVRLRAAIVASQCKYTVDIVRSYCGWICEVRAPLGASLKVLSFRQKETRTKSGSLGFIIF
jgi:hypothetical protein